jgi:hypothetical protein
VKKLAPFALCILFFSCTEKPAETAASSLPLEGTWRLFSGTTITGKDTVNTDYTQGQQMLKILNDSHFAFVLHDLNKGQDTANKIFSAGAGTYTLNGDQYSEHLDFCNQREWEGHTFNFTVAINNDTLVQQGVEKVENLGVDRLIIERYVRVKK